MPIRSSFAPVEVPEVDIWTILFENRDRPYPDDKVLFTDSDTGKSYTYRDARDKAVDFGKGLKATWEWQKGDVLAFYAPNSIDTAIVTWGTLWAGGIASPANPTYTVNELAFQLKDSGAKALVTQLPMLPNALAAAARVGIPSDRVILLGEQRDPSARAKHFTSIRLTGGASRWRRTKAKPTDLAYLVYSSGTTGLPKGVMLQHSNIVANLCQQRAAEFDLSWDYGSDKQGDTILAFLPFFHIYGLTCLLHQAVYLGLRLIVMPKYDLEKFCAAVQNFKCTFGYVVPPLVLQLTKHPLVAKYDLSTLRMLNSGAAPLTKDLVEAFYARTKIPVKQGYGLSETSPVTHAQPWAKWRSTVGSIGNLVANMEAKFVDEANNELPEPNSTGELWLRGPNVFRGYLNNQEGTANSLDPDGWFHTGDIGHVDAEGNFYITDRVKELIKYKGFQVAPAELEGLLVSHPAVIDAAVIGVQDDAQATEVPRAYVALAPGVESSDATAREIAGWLAARVTGHKKLRGGVRFVPEIPKSAAGKILRRLLKDQAKQEGVSSKPKL